ncbi:MAG: hypothetical protein U0531_04440 [Dehalococcoidia bacterium]
MMPPNAEAADRAGPPWATLAQLLTALALSAFVLGAITAAQSGPTRPAQSEVRPATPAPAPASAAPGATPAAVLRPPATVRIDYGSIAEAGAALGFPVYEPRALPGGVTPSAVWWQSGAPVLTPGEPPHGVLLAGFVAANGELALTVGQGPGIGLSGAGAPPGYHGGAQLSDGRSVSWVHGRTVERDLSGGAPAWIDDEVRVGVVATGRDTGWWLQSRRLSLDDLLRIAESMR